jgi:hypothetical protein
MLFWVIIALVALGALHNMRLARLVLQAERAKQERYQDIARKMSGQKPGPAGAIVLVLLFVFVAVVIIGTTFAHAQADVEGPNCDGHVVRLQNVVTLEPNDNEICSPKWVTRNVAQAHRILTTCPIDSHCHIEGSYSNRGIETITKVTRLN